MILLTMGILKFSFLEIKASVNSERQAMVRTGSKMVRWLHTSKKRVSRGISSRPVTSTRTRIRNMPTWTMLVISQW